MYMKLLDNNRAWTDAMARPDDKMFFSPPVDHISVKDTVRHLVEHIVLFHTLPPLIR